MASEGARTGNGYLRHVLADGVRPFLYRSRVRALLGVSDVGGVEMNFARPVPVGGFAYRDQHFSAEFEIADEVPADGQHRRAVVAEHAAPVRHRPDSLERTPNPSVQCDAQKPATESNGRCADSAASTVVIPDRMRPAERPKRSGAGAKPEPGQIEPRSEPARSDELVEHTRRAPAPSDHVIADAHAPPAAPAADQGSGSHALEPARRHDRAHDFSPTAKPDAKLTSEATARVAPSGVSERTAAAAVASSSGAAVTTGPDGGAPESLRGPDIGPALVGARSVPNRRNAAPQRNEPPRPRAVTDLASSPPAGSARSSPLAISASLVRQQGPEPAGLNLPTRMRARPPQPPSAAAAPWGRSGPQNPASADIASSRIAEAAATQPPVIVINSGRDPGTTPFAFWERRHLTHLRLRMRR